MTLRPEHPLQLPETLAAQGIALRGEGDDDLPFLERLYISVRWSELTAVGWPEQAKLDFLKSQFALQTKHYRSHYHDGEFAIVTRQGEPIGRLYLFRGASDYRIFDISLLPEARGTGIGTGLLQAVMAAAADRKVSIHVEQFNPAQTLYRRMGFREVSTNGPYWLMEWRRESGAMQEAS